jgi:hypothetical protein
LEEGSVIKRRIAAVAVVAGLALACVQQGNTEEMVREALDQANIRDVDVDLDSAAQTVRLTGTVETLADRVRAQELAAAIVGTTGHVRNEISVEGLGVVEPRQHDR